ncbi:hypothetical protein [Synechococcus sp. UW140]|uniref:hypothetical protein n=1 Tax=Synechococcus sp. UW140 TaxID=368503 RepID=UPI001FCC94CF|nr:hypothetical protein [Synechococcus sp. UW140]
MNVREVSAMDEQKPITPLTGPVFDDEGRLTYMGVDGRRYVVVDGVDFDEQDAAKVMKVLQLAGGVFEEIEQHCRHWLQMVDDSPLSEEEALSLLLATLETVLERKQDDQQDPGQGS